MKDPDGWIMGRVEGGGHTVPGTDGYRTEFVAITGLIPGIPGTDDELTAILAKRMKAVAAHYHVPILEPTRYMKGWIISVEISGETALVALGHPGREAMTFALPVEEASMLPPMPPAPLVTIGYQTRGSMRWITEVLVDEGDDES
jgi:hypothetical protein